MNKKRYTAPLHKFGSHKPIRPGDQSGLPVVLSVTNSSKKPATATIFNAYESGVDNNFGNPPEIKVSSGCPNISYRFILEDTKVSKSRCNSMKFICDNQDFFDQKFYYQVCDRSGCLIRTPFLIPVNPFSFVLTNRDVKHGVVIDGRLSMSFIVPGKTCVTIYCYDDTKYGDIRFALPENVTQGLKPTKNELAEYKRALDKQEKERPRLEAERDKKYAALVDERCVVCDKQLTYREANLEFSPYAFGHTCAKHSSHAFSFQPEVTKKKLGLIKRYSEKLSHCSICNSKLSKKEQDKIGEFDYFIACDIHRDKIALSIPTEQFQRAYFIYKKTVKKPTKEGFTEWCNSEDGIQVRKEIRAKLKSGNPKSRKITRK